MKVNVFVMLMNLLVIFAATNCELLSAAELPLSDLQKPEEIASTLSTTTLSASIETLSNETTKSPEASPSSGNESTEGRATTDALPPLVFPTDEDKILPKNETALKILQSVSSQNANSSEEPKLNETSVEVTTLSTSPSSAENITSTILPISSEANTTVGMNSTIEKAEDDYDNLSEEKEKSDAENIQDNTDRQQQEDELEEEFARNGSDKATINLFEDPVTNEPALHSGHFALIFASSLITLSVVAYVGLILWRSKLERRYGMRQRLVTEDAFYSDNNNDVRYFGL